VLIWSTVALYVFLPVTTEIKPAGTRTIFYQRKRSDYLAATPACSKWAKWPQSEINPAYSSVFYA